MSFSIYDASVPVFVRALKNLAHVLEKGRADAEARAIEPSVLINDRLAPDMLPLSRQIQIACDMVKNGAARLAGIDPPSYEDNEASFEELQSRISKTVAFLDGIDAGKLGGSETRQITLKFPGREMQFTGADYLVGFVLPNLYFHSTMAYAILRHNGAKLGKMDFMGGG